MKIPSEAELIEMERRALCLVEVREYLERKADNLYDKADRATTVEEESRLLVKYDRVAKSHDCIEKLADDLDILIELARAGVLNAR